MRKLLLPALAAFSLAACEPSGVAYGHYNGIVAAMDSTLFDEVSWEIYRALEPTIVTVRDEKAFTLTYQNPLQPDWADLRRFRQLLLVGTGEEAWIEDAVEKAGSAVTGPGRYTVQDVWARGQQVTLILVSGAGAAADEVRSYLPEINEALDQQFRAWVVERMYTTGVDSALADTLMAVGRFQLFVPEVYRWAHRDSLFQFRNDNPDPSELIRSVAVTWKSPVPLDMQPEGLLAWREEIASAYAEPQAVDLSMVDAGPFEYRGRPAYQIRAIWTNPPESSWPAAGPFVTRAVICPQQNRMYLLDAWLYAPGKDKYEYMIQMETILDSFRCGPA